MKESSSDFSIVKNYIELKAKYDLEIKNFNDKIKALEEQAKKNSAGLESELKKRAEHTNTLEKKIQELTQVLTEKDEKLKTLGLQLHKLKRESSENQAPPTEAAEGAKKSKFGLFK